MKKIILITAAFLLVSTAFSQSLKKGNKLIANQNFSGAEGHFNKALTVNSTDPSANFGMGLVYSDSANNSRDLFKALNYVNVAKVNFDKLDVGSKAKISSDLNEDIINKKFISIDDEMYNDLILKNDTTLLNPFLARCPFSNHIIEVKQLRNNLVFEDVHNQNTIDAYEFYMANFSDSLNVAKAVKHRNQLVFEQVKDSNNVEVYKKFISDYPEATEVEDANKLMNVLIFKTVTDTNNIEIYNKYINDFPDAKEVDEAIKLRNNLAFDQAAKINTILSYEAFMKKYPEAEQCKYAESIIKELNSWTCIPGMKVGKIVYNSSIEGLNEIYGAENLINDSLIIDGDLFNGTYLFPNEADKRLFIIWKNKKENKYPDRIVILGKKWQTHKGVKIGSTLEDLMLFNGKEFDLSGFRKKGEGTVISWKGGDLGVLHILRKNFFLQLSYNESKFFNIPEKGLLLLTNSDFVSTDNEDLQDIDLKVDRMEILFPE